MSIGGVTLEQFETLDERAQKKAIAAAAAGVGSGAAPQKFGDFIFVHSGLNLSTCPADTWIVIHHPPNTTLSNIPSGWFEVGTADGRNTQFPAAVFQSMLMNENNKRSGLGAPAIPAALFAAPASQPASAPGEEEP